MESEFELHDLIKNRDHLNVLRYVRMHQLREPEVVVEHGLLLLGSDLNKKSIKGGGEIVRLAILEQICLAALDCNKIQLAEQCLDRLKDAGIAAESNRFRLLLARCLEADGDTNGAEIIYNELLKENPSNLLALKRKYCLLKSKPGQIVATIEALNEYLQQNFSDTAAWYELGKLRMELGDFKGAVFCLEEVLLGSPASAVIHCELAECYATIGTSTNNLDDLLAARKHIAQAIELEPNFVRAQMGLVTISNMYLQQMVQASKKDYDEFECDVAKELIRYGTELVLQSYKGSVLYPTMKTLMNEYTENL